MTIIFLLLFILSNPKQASAQEECQPRSCTPTGPTVRFPFRLINQHPTHCGYPGFNLSCSSTNTTLFHFQFPIRASARNTILLLPISSTATVTQIDYSNQVIHLNILNGSCLPTQIETPNANLNVNETPPNFEMYENNIDGQTLFNCSGRPDMVRSSGRVGCLGHGSYQVYAFRSYYTVTDVMVGNCVKMYNVSDLPDEVFNGPRLYGGGGARFRWREPRCGDCEARGMDCRWRRRRNGTDSGGGETETECFQRPTQPQRDRNNHHTGISRNVVIAISVAGTFLVILLLSASYHLYTVKKRKRDNERRIHQFLEDYKALRPTRYTYAEVKKITDGFNQQLGRGGYGTVYKGKLSRDILVAVKVLNTIKGNGDDFINEVGTIGKIHHVNVVRLVGYCADGYRRALVYEYMENDSLEKYISSGKQGKTLGWENLKNIALGVAKGLEYLHQGCNQRILHFDIKPHNILLDHNLNPKVADFGLAKLCSKEQSVVTMTAARGTVGYIAPEVFSRNFGKVSYKSDIYSFGMLLLDMVGGRKNFHARGDDSSSQIYFPEWMYNQLEKGEDIAIEIDKDDDNDIVKRLIIIGLWCIQWHPVDRPSTKVVIQMLDNENMPVMPPNPFAASTPVDQTTASTGSIFTSRSDSTTQATMKSKLS